MHAFDSFIININKPLHTLETGIIFIVIYYWSAQDVC